MVDVGSSWCSVIGGEWSSMISTRDVWRMIGGVVGCWWHISELLRSVDRRWNKFGWCSVCNDWSWDVSGGWSSNNWLEEFSWCLSDISVSWRDICVGGSGICMRSSDEFRWSWRKISCRWRCNKLGWLMSDDGFGNDWSNSGRFRDDSVESIHCIGGLLKNAFSSTRYRWRECQV